MAPKFTPRVPPIATAALTLGLLGAASAFPGSQGAAGQDVEELGRVYGTRPPQAYFDRLREDPGAFRFSRAWIPRLETALRQRDRLAPGGDGPGGPGAARALGLTSPPLGDAPRPVLGQREGAVEGTFYFPLVLAQFSDSPPLPAFSVEDVRTGFLDGPSATGTITDYYREVSGGRVDLLGVASEWVRPSLTSTDVAGGSSGLGNGSRVGEFIVRALAQLDTGEIDWGQFDNDGPDGIPNSGDDDGFVDVLAVVHPLSGGECGGTGSADRIWSHRWSLGAAFDVYVTESPSNSISNPTGRVRVNDYTVQPLLACNQQDLNGIGVFVHELGHGFGLPDLYAVGGNHAAVGHWGLMASGSWGCQGNDPARPCHMGAWSKEVMGWAEIVDVPPGQDLPDVALTPVQEGGPIFRVPANDGSGEYLLLENRQPVGFDEALYRGGLLVWQVDPQVLNQTWGFNQVNSDPANQGVRIRQADGRDDLSKVGRGRGDAGDPFPGNSGNDVFHASSKPASVTALGSPSGITLVDIVEVGADIRMRLLSRMTRVVVTTAGPPEVEPLVTLDGNPLPVAGGASPEFQSAPFQRHLLQAAAAEGSEPGVRPAFAGWEDGSPRDREFVSGLGDTTLVASYEGEEVRMAFQVSSPVEGFSAGTVRFEPEASDGWVARGESVTVLVEPTKGFGFDSWTGDLTGTQNPQTFLATDPLSAVAGMIMTYGVSGPGEGVELEAASPATLVFTVQDATYPVAWSVASGVLPDGLTLGFDGQVTGAPLEVGEFPVVIRARDARGLVAGLDLRFTVTEPNIGVETLVAPFLLTGTRPTAAQSVFLDRTGNLSGSYDLGDFRAFLIRNPDLPMSAEVRAQVEQIIHLGPVSRSQGGSP